jgi:hypothetical protein
MKLQEQEFLARLKSEFEGNDIAFDVFTGSVNIGYYLLKPDWGKLATKARKEGVQGREQVSDFLIREIRKLYRRRVKAESSVRSL